jgi:hypothetical protein
MRCIVKRTTNPTPTISNIIRRQLVPTEMTWHIPGHFEGRTSSHRTREEHGTFWPHTLWSRRKHLSQLTREAEDKIDLAVN